MRKGILTALLCGTLFLALRAQQETTWIRINQLGYAPKGVKAAVLAGKTAFTPSGFELIEVATGKVVFTGTTGRSYGSYGPFANSYRLDFSAFHTKGTYFLRAGEIKSPPFSISEKVYKGAADFCLRYMRQQRSGFNPFLKDSCHTHDGYTLYAPVADSTHIEVTGGWHDASDYLQYSTTSANAAYHLMAAYRDFPGVFKDSQQANGLSGSNGLADVLDEAKWGLDWLLKMHPQKDWMFNQVGDDRDHKGMRIPKEDTNYYGKGLERPVYFCNGQPQVRGKFMNNTTGVASTAGKFASAFALGSRLFTGTYSALLKEKAGTAFQMGLMQPGVCQTASVRSPYIYAEDNWTDDMELGAAAVSDTSLAYAYALKEPVTPWLGADTASHYQWYPFINIGHYELAGMLKDKRRDTLIGFYRQGIEKVWQKARSNAFYRGIPFIWCSNNLTVSFAIQCYWYRQLSHDTHYLPLEQACFDWIFGCNPWGTSMVYGLPSAGDTPEDPHSAFTHLGHYPIDGGLVDGPVYTSIYSSLIGIRLSQDDEYQAFQSNLAVYHDDYGDYSTNEPTMDGTASLIYLLAAEEAQADPLSSLTISHGGVIRGSTLKKEVALLFTGDEYGEGLPTIIKTLKKQKITGSFFFTGRFYRNPLFKKDLRQLLRNGYYLGPHSNGHLLYNDWQKRDSLLINKNTFGKDLYQNFMAMKAIGADLKNVKYFIPPYEWWNDTIAVWSREKGMQIVSFTPGPGTNADYTFPEMGNSYKDNERLLQLIRQYQSTSQQGLNGALILIHAGTDPRRKEKLYDRLDELITWLKTLGYKFKSIDELFKVPVIDK